jgi:SSS family solute:Na+ symporter
VGKKKLLVGRVSLIVIGILGLCLALYLEDLIKTLELAYTFFASGVIIPVIAGFYKNKLKINSTGALAAMIGGGLTAIILKIGKIGLDAILVGMSVSFLLAFFGSWAKDLYLFVYRKK